MDKEGEAVCGSKKAKCFVASGVCDAERDSLMEGPYEECWQFICFSTVSSSLYKQVHYKIWTKGDVVLANEYLLIKGKYTYLMRLKWAHLHLLLGCLHNVRGALIGSNKAVKKQREGNYPLVSPFTNNTWTAITCIYSPAQMAENVSKLWNRPLLCAIYEVVIMWVTYNIVSLAP